MAYNLETNPDGLGWRKVISWNRPYGVAQRYLRYETKEEADRAVESRFHHNNQICRVVEAIG